jgi:hypothetical protein
MRAGRKIRGSRGNPLFHPRIFLWLGLSPIACAARPLALNAPDIAPNQGRDQAHLEIEPLTTGGPGTVVGDFMPPGPAAVLTAAMKAEIEGRALHGGEPGGYVVRCRLDRFAVRSRGSIVESDEMLVLYADLSCEARRKSDAAVVWRGELRGRTAQETANILASDTGTTQRLVDRAMSDAARELASDLALRALGLLGEPSARVFADESHQRDSAGLDDAPYGAAALQENPAAVSGALRALGEHDAAMRAASWNVAAMAAGPGDEWVAGNAMRLDDDPIVRFVQYKALARLASAVALEQLHTARRKEHDSLLAEFIDDAVSSRGIGVARSIRNAPK